MVIDYGLNNFQKTQLLKERIILFKGIKKYHIVNKRFFDSAKYLKNKSYDQILFIDGGDTIFQEDITHVFNKDKNTFRVVPLGMKVLFFEWFIFDNFEKKIKEKIWKIVKNKTVINAGVIFAPYNKFLSLCNDMEKLIKDKDAFGPDQIILNYHLYQEGFIFLDSKYNFMMSTEEKGFIVKKGIFYKPGGEKIAIVHNAGQMDFFRPIKNFGFGKEFNQIKHVIYNVKKTQYQILCWYKKNFKD
ncbi:MAG: hypothetical protein AAB437_04360 [Patescibacteria group bacterium]